MSAADTLPQDAKLETSPAQAEPSLPPNPFQGKHYEDNLVVDVTPEEPERSEDPNHPKRKPSAEEKQTPEPQKRPKTSEDFQEAQDVPKTPEEQETRADTSEQREQQFNACVQAIAQVKMLKEEAKRLFAQEEYMKALSKYQDATGYFSKVLIPRELLDECQDLRAQLLNNIALCSIKLEDFTFALKVSEQGVKEFPQNVKLIYTYASALRHAGEYDRALAHLKRLSRARPDDEQFVSKIKEIQKEKEEHMSKLKEMYGGKLLPSPPKEAAPEPQTSSLMTWGLIAAFATLAIGGFFLTRKYLSRKQ